MSDIRNLIFAPGTQGPPGPGTSGSGGITSGANVAISGISIFNAGQSTSSVLKFNTLFAGSNTNIVNNGNGTVTISSIVDLAQGINTVPVANLPIASSSSLGVVQPDGSSISILNGVISANFDAPVTSVFGRTGDVVAQNSDYNFSQIDGIVAPGQLPIGTNAAFGAFKVDNTTITAPGGVLQVVPQGSTLPTLAPYTFLGNSTNASAVAAQTSIVKIGNADEVNVLQALGATEFSIALPAGSGDFSSGGFKAAAGKSLTVSFFTDVGTVYPYSDMTQYGGYFEIRAEAQGQGNRTLLTSWTGNMFLSAYDGGNGVPNTIFLNSESVKVNQDLQFVISPVGSLPVSTEEGALENDGTYLTMNIAGQRHIIGSKGQRFESDYANPGTVTEGFSVVAGSTTSRVFIRAATDLLAGSVQIPTAFADGQIFSISSEVDVAALTVSATTGNMDDGNPSMVFSITSKGSLDFQWDATNNLWLIQNFSSKVVEQYHDYVDITGTATLDPSAYAAASVNLTGDCTIDLALDPTDTKIQSFTLTIRTNGHAATFSNVSWAGGTMPTLSTSSSVFDVLVFLRLPNNDFFGQWAGGVSLLAVPNLAYP